MKKINRITAIILAGIVLFLLTCGGLAIANYYRKILKTGFHNSLPYGFGKEASVILLAGQSNAAGCSQDPYLKQNVSAEKYQEYQNGYDNVYINYFVSGTNESHEFVKCKARQGEGFEPGFFGPELGLAEKLHELYPEKLFFIVKYAWSGTNLYEQWLSPSAQKQTGPLYKGFVQYIQTSINYLRLKNYSVHIEGLCWMQGESDAIIQEYALAYENNLSCFIQDIRKEYSAYQSNDGIAFVDAYIADTIWDYYIEVNQAKQSIADLSPNNTVIDTISHGLTLTKEPENEPDLAHYDSLSEIRLGQLFAEELANFLN